VRTIDEETPIIEASRRMERTGHTAFPVVDDKGELVGIISRKDLDKAGHHGLGHAPVKGFMSRNLISVGADSTLQEIQSLMTENAIGRVPVLEGKKPVGIVTRKDVIRALHGSEYLHGLPSSGKTPEYSRSELVEMIQRSLPGDVQALLRSISKEAEAGGYKVFLVGGVVRDLLLGFPNLDLDIVVEGDGIEFARLLSKELKGRVRSHRKFGTAVVILPTGRRIDVATARTEFYEHPAALPTVEVSSIRQDLFRRDFTINAMAIALAGESFGELLDYFGGLRDLERRHIRILHNLSFVEDPTRIFRAVRFEQRYGFLLERQTEMLARRAVDMEIVGKLTNARVRDELVDIFSEPCPMPFRAVQRLEDLGALQTLQPDLEVSEAMTERFGLMQLYIEDARMLIGNEGKPWITSVAVLIAELQPAEAVKWCHLMRFKRADKDTIMQCLERVPKIIEALASAKLPPSAVVESLDPLKREALAYLYVLGGEKARGAVQAYVGEWTSVSPEISGQDLKALGLPPSRAYGEILSRIRSDLLDGKISGRDEEIQLARKLIEEKTKRSV
jgi:tRNA nucleotidyltransferase (CCA-adding enzyme)